MIDLKALAEEFENLGLGDFEYRNTDEEYIDLYCTKIRDLEKLMEAARNLQGKLRQEVDERREMVGITVGAKRALSNG